MHIADGYLGGGILVVTGAVSLGAAAVTLKKARNELDDKTVPLVALCAAFVFAAMMLNFPVAPGTSGHFLGAAMLALILGPYLGSLVMMLVLIVQAVLFADGGLSALGANIFNMAVVGVWGAYAIFLIGKAFLPRNRLGYMVSAAAAAWSSVVMAAMLCGLELAFSLPFLPTGTVPAIVGVHLLIGIVEAFITVVVLGTVTTVRPDLVRTYPYRPATAEAEVR
jgi:cobalt/nickel transport system permease protein